MVEWRKAVAESSEQNLLIHWSFFDTNILASHLTLLFLLPCPSLGLPCWRQVHLKATPRGFRGNGRKEARIADCSRLLWTQRINKQWRLCVCCDERWATGGIDLTGGNRESVFQLRVVAIRSELKGTAAKNIGKKNVLRREQCYLASEKVLCHLCLGERGGIRVMLKVLRPGEETFPCAAITLNTHTCWVCCISYSSVLIWNELPVNN